MRLQVHLPLIKVSSPYLCGSFSYLQIKQEALDNCAPVLQETLSGMVFLAELHSEQAESILQASWYPKALSSLLTYYAGHAAQVARLLIESVLGDEVHRSLDHHLNVALLAVQATIAAVNVPGQHLHASLGQPPVATGSHVM